MKLSDLLVAYRKNNNATQSALAERIGIAQTAIRKMELGFLKTSQTNVFTRLMNVIGYRVFVKHTHTNASYELIPDNNELAKKTEITLNPSQDMPSVKGDIDEKETIDFMSKAFWKLSSNAQKKTIELFKAIADISGEQKQSETKKRSA